MSDNQKDIKKTASKSSNSWGGWRGGVKPKLPEKLREKRRIESKEKYSKGKVRIQIPVISDLEKRFKALKSHLLFKKNEQLLEYLVELGEKENNLTNNVNK